MISITTLISQNQDTLRAHWSTYGGNTTWEYFCSEVGQTARALLYNLNSMDPESIAYFADLTMWAVDGIPAADTGETYPAVAAHLPLVSSICGIPYVVNVRRQDGKLAVRLGGFKPDAWALQDFAMNAEHGVYGCVPGETYCSMERGEAGGTLDDQVDGGFAGAPLNFAQE